MSRVALAMLRCRRYDSVRPQSAGRDGRLSGAEMDKQAETLQELRTVIAAQQELLRIALYMMTQGPIAYRDQELRCVLKPDQVRATCAVALGAGQSLNTVLKLSDDQGIGIRDLYPIARSVVEGFINAAFFVTQPVDISRRALDHRHYAAWKHHNRIIGSGDVMIPIGAANPKAEAARLFPNFAEKGKDSWTTLNAVDRINHIGKVVKASAGALIGAYAGIYAVSSEIVHGSVYGMSFFQRSCSRAIRCGIQIGDGRTSHRHTSRGLARFQRLPVRIRKRTGTWSLCSCRTRPVQAFVQGGDG